MIWVVDTCVILDVLDNHPEFAKVPSQALQSKLDDVLVVAPITYVELARPTGLVKRQELPLPRGSQKPNRSPLDLSNVNVYTYVEILIGGKELR